MAIIIAEKGDNLGSLETSLDAIKYLNENKEVVYPILYSNYNNLGIVMANLKEYNKSILFYNDALKFSKNYTDIITALNNKASSYRYSGRYKNALNIYEELLNKVDEKKDLIEYARVIDNMEYTKWLQNHNYNPVSELKEALKIRLKEKDLFGQNASYSHLADYYTKKQPDSALGYAAKMYGVAKALKSPDDQIEALQKLVILENPEKSKDYFLTYQKLNDSLQTARNKAKNQFALIRYETEKSKADFEKSQADNVKKQNRILRQNIGLGALVIVLIMGVVWYKIRRKRLQKEKELEVKNTELWYSKKVHDVFSNGLHRVMTKLENKEYQDKEEMLDELEIVYERSRDISYYDEPTDKKHLTEMLESYSSRNTMQLILVGISEIDWDKLNKDIRFEVYNVLQELMTNMKKHSKASRVTIKMSRVHNDITIWYSDNGIGCETFSPKNGIKNTGNRMEAIGGTITFDSSEGFKAELKFSVQ
ncbi:ATP-binding protein [Elizabethkingia meningoseptica]|uniref:ATP-binding protein n=1 Tax=Elizabethkingia meningoseptica TaxID=238 RepID=UPI001117188F|nr:tetratricopeptide repeat-containing sensor histidine kinase [Elizabethkingia meningoseptica]